MKKTINLYKRKPNPKYYVGLDRYPLINKYININVMQICYPNYFERRVI